MLAIQFLAPYHAEAGERRVALVIGNGAYATAPRLANPTSDARLIAQALLSAGFDRVILKTDLGRADTSATLTEFGRVARGAEVALIYFAGHGLEADGRNWLLPADAHVRSPADLRGQAIAIEDLMAPLKGAAGLRLLILDACRSDPFLLAPSAAQSAAVRQRLVVRGLAPTTSSDVMVVYAAKSGTSALDGDGGNSPFAAALANRLQRPGLDVRRFIGLVRDDVVRATRGAQEPFTYGSVPATSPFLAAPDAEFALADADAEGWHRAQSPQSIDNLNAYLRLFPVGEHWQEAAAQLATMRAQAVRKGAGTPVTGRVMRVAADGRGPYPTLAAAVAAARPGDRILLGSGTYRTGPLTLNTSITVSGPAPGLAPATITGLPDKIRSSLLYARNAEVRLENLALRCRCTAVSAWGADLTVYRLDIEVASEVPGLPSSGISTGEAASVTVVDSAIRGSDLSLSVGSRMIAVGNTLSGAIFSRQEGLGVFAGNAINVAGGGILRFAGQGQTLFTRNRVDGRRLPISTRFTRYALFGLRGASGRLAVIDNEILTASGFRSEDIHECVEVVRCEIELRGNRFAAGPAVAHSPPPASRGPQAGPPRDHSSAKGSRARF